MPATLPLSQVLNNNDLFWSRDSSIGVCKIGPFPDGATDRYVIGGDWVANVLRAALTQDNGVTWAEQNAAGAPSIGDDSGGSPAPHTFRVFGACHDTVNRIIYAVYWNTSYKISVRPFDIATKTWGAEAASTVDLVFTDTMVEANLVCEYTSQSGGRVEILFNRLDASGVDRRTKVYGFAYSVGGGFSGVVNAFGADGDGYNYRMGTMGRDPISAGIGVNATRELKTGTDATTGPLWMSISSGAYSGVQQVAGGIHCNLVCQIFVDSAGIAGWVYLEGTRGIGIGNSMHIVRALFGPSPAWEDATPGPMQISQAAGQALYQVQSFLEISGTHYVAYGYTTDAANYTFAYITSAGLGQGWDTTETVIGTADGSGTPNFVGNGAFAVPGSILLMFPYGTDFGIGYYEATVAPPLPVVSIIPKLQLQLIPLPDTIRCLPRKCLCTGKLMMRGKVIYANPKH